MGLPQNIDTSSIYEYADLFINKDKTSTISFQVLKEKIHGYLGLDIQENPNKRRLETIHKDGKTYYIIGGVYISPYAKSILQANGIIKGILLDTTWRVMPFYVTSIIMGSVMNIGIPLGFAFGSGEDKNLYERHFTAFATKTGIDLSKIVIESDQGSALKAICDEKGINHLACIRHLLVSLRFSSYSFAATKLIKAESEIDLNNYKAEFSKTFAAIEDEQELNDLNKILGKIGMQFSDGKINVIDEKRWNQVSLLSRIDLKMPSTTNSLESVHGHLNKKTPRNNSFWSSVNRLCTSFIIKTNLLNSRIQHNFEFLRGNTYKKLKTFTEDKMHLQLGFYATTVDKCSCGDNKLISAILGVDIPCCHRIALGAVFPLCPKLDISLSNQWNELVYDFNELPPIIEVQKSDADDMVKKYVVNTIRRYSCYSKRDEIEKYVNERYNPEQDDDIFIDGREASLIPLIYKGIEFFSNKRAELKAAKGKQAKNKK